MGFPNTVSSAAQIEFRRMIQYLRTTLSWGQIVTQSGMRQKIHMGSKGGSLEELLKANYRGTANWDIYKLVEKLYTVKYNSMKELEEIIMVKVPGTKERVLEYLREHPGSVIKAVVDNVKGAGDVAIKEMINRGDIVAVETLSIKNRPSKKLYLPDQKIVVEAPEDMHDAVIGVKVTPTPFLDQLDKKIDEGKTAKEAFNEVIPEATGSDDEHTNKSWDDIRSELMNLADLIRNFTSVPDDAPKFIKEAVTGKLNQKADSLLKWVEQELD